VVHGHGHDQMKVVAVGEMQELGECSMQVADFWVFFFFFFLALPEFELEASCFLDRCSTT
jgi:hypothetical protein